MSVKREVMHESDVPMPRKTCAVRSKLDCLKPNPEGSYQAGRYSDYRVPIASVGISCLSTDSQSMAYRMMSPGVGMSGRPNPCYRANPRNFRIAYGARALGQRSLHSSPRAGKPSTWRREAGVSMEHGLRGTRDA
jgi:hypothetical protein